ncbi:prepilin peptidase [Lentibacillus salinarum]|uniref:Prepilin peptidase n=1 Tax=Lentibacillus salinarum TaxID=446820 RepID=A0ABW3ZXV8_9BACI
MTSAFLALLTVMVIVTTYTDFKYRKIYNKFLLPCIILSLLLHTIHGTLTDSLIAMAFAFAFFFLAYIFGMTSPGDVKLFAVAGSVVANFTIVAAAIVAYMLIQFGMAIYAMIKACRKHNMSPLTILKQDAIGFTTKTGSVIQPIHFPGAILIGASVWSVQVIALI